MKRVRVWPLVVLVLVALIVGYALWPTPSGSPDHSTQSDAPDGASALPRLAAALGRPVRTLQNSFRLAPGLGELVVLTPVRPFTAVQAGTVLTFVRRGGVLVYASVQGDPELDRALGVRRTISPVPGQGTGVHSRLPGVARIVGTPTVDPLLPAPGQLPLVRGVQGAVLAFEEMIGRGRAVVMADPLPLCNGYLEQADDGRLAAGLLALAPPGRPVAFDEYHHQAAAAAPTVSWSAAPWAGLAWAILATFLVLLLRGRSFGPRLELTAGAVRSSAEYVAAVGRLLRRSRARAETAEVLLEATRRQLAARHGLGPDLEGLAERAPAEARELAAAEQELSGPTEAILLAAGRRLHRLRWP